MHGIADFFKVPVHLEKVDRRVGDGDGLLKILRKEPLIPAGMVSSLQVLFDVKQVWEGMAFVRVFV